MSPFATATQTAPPATAMPWGLKPSRMVLTTVLVRGSMREIVPAAWLVTQIAPAPAASASGSSPVGMIASILPVAASILQTAFLPRQRTQADPKATATSVGWLPTTMRLIRLVAASIRQMDPLPTFATQAAPAPNATCPGNTPLGALNLCWTTPSRMLTRVIADGNDSWKSAGGCVIHREPAPAATKSAVLPGSLILSFTASVAGSTCTTSLSAKLPTNKPRPPAATIPVGFASLSPPTSSARSERTLTRVSVSSLPSTTHTNDIRDPVRSRVDLHQRVRDDRRRLTGSRQEHGHDRCRGRDHDSTQRGDRAPPRTASYGRRSRRRLEGRIVPEDRLLEGDQRCTRFEPQH